MTDMEWQLIGDDHWVFGLKVRGVIRRRLAEVYHDPNRQHPWVWMVRDKELTFAKNGLGYNLSDALERAETLLGVTSGSDDQLPESGTSGER